jgi:hypothetical protein
MNRRQSLVRLILHAPSDCFYRSDANGGTRLKVVDVLTATSDPLKSAIHPLSELTVPHESSTSQLRDLDFQ